MLVLKEWLPNFLQEQNVLAAPRKGVLLYVLSLRSAWKHGTN